LVKFRRAVIKESNLFLKGQVFEYIILVDYFKYKTKYCDLKD